MFLQVQWKNTLISLDRRTCLFGSYFLWPSIACLWSFRWFEVHLSKGCVNSQISEGLTLVAPVLTTKPCSDVSGTETSPVLWKDMCWSYWSKGFFSCQFRSILWILSLLGLTVWLLLTIAFTFDNEHYLYPLPKYQPDHVTAPKRHLCLLSFVCSFFSPTRNLSLLHCLSNLTYSLFIYEVLERGDHASFLSSTMHGLLPAQVFNWYSLNRIEPDQMSWRVTVISFSSQSRCWPKQPEQNFREFQIS